MPKTPPVKPPGSVERVGTFLEKWLEAGLFGSRWLMAPFYVGLIGALLILLLSSSRRCCTSCRCSSAAPPSPRTASCWPCR